ncbi:MAG: outer membrane protein assembly factor [Bacteroidales bacterium]|nr:outer membrane protein assembly factor [Bacteroidales bacterium]MCF8457407.1 outer membrane protein assembly factor [Bacteroidales bacterium]
MKRNLLSLAIVLLLASTGFSQQEKEDEEEIRTGLNVGGLPVIAFDSDLGLQYGALANLYFYGDGSQYPEYRHSLYFEISRFTKGSGINRFFYDSKYLIPKVRLTVDLSYLTEQALDFYGFNGYESVYNPDWVDDSQPDDVYQSRLFYRHARNRFRLTMDFQGKLKFDHLNWSAGLAFFNDKIGSIDIEKFNKGKDEEDKLPDIDGLYEKYIQWGIIPIDQAKGGNTNYLKFGLVYDSRDNEPNPMKGIWTEAIVVTAPSFIGNDFPHTKFKFSHRQYFTLIPKNLSLAYRLEYQGTIGGTAPWFIQPNIHTPYLRSANSEGLGGGKTMRGIMRSRVVGDAIALGNIELRWKFARFQFIKQNFYLGLNLFYDAGQVVKEIDYTIPQSLTPKVREEYFSTDKEKLHSSYGLGLRIAMNQNFIIAVDYGLALNEQDGKSGLYIGLNYLF